ncbi:hypothetical protein [Thiobacillus denitrificans]|uniref:hypothetical protein n=1 Tax=Thiobacillus denitrificans TaxID=36861 RepID=UPI00035D14D3|nr:hypothetical protein [Thiobacillus denitrificans]
MQFNKCQREGVAKVLDNLATACMVAVVLSGLVDHKIGWEVVLLLLVLFAVLVSVAVYLRKGDPE